MIDLTPSKYKKMLNEKYEYIVEDDSIREIRKLNEKINRLEKELQTLKDNLYEAFFKEDFTDKK